MYDETFWTIFCFGGFFDLVYRNRIEYVVRSLLVNREIPSLSASFCLSSASFPLSYSPLARGIANSSVGFGCQVNYANRIDGWVLIIRMSSGCARVGSIYWEWENQQILVSFLFMPLRMSDENTPLLNLCYSKFVFRFVEVVWWRFSKAFDM